MSETVTVSKKTYHLLIVVLVIALVVGSFSAGYVMGGAGTAGAKTGTTVQSSTGSTPTGSTGSVGSGRISVSIDDDPTMGDANAAVRVIEFSDFQCPFCGRFFQQTLSSVEKDYIDTGKVLFVYRDFPLSSIHPAAQKAAETAECADEQGKWRQMHDMLFQRQQTWGSQDETFAVTQFKSYAKELGLNSGQFDSCLDSGKYADEVGKDFQDGVDAGVSGTPTFYIGNDQKGYQQVVGAQPYSVIKSAIDAALAA